MKRIALPWRRVRNALRDRLEDYLGVTVLLFLVLVVSLQVISRYVFAHPLLWTEEIARYLLILLAFIGAPIAVRKGSSISLDFLVAGLPGKVRRTLSVVSLILELGFYIAVAYQSVSMALFSRGRFLVSVQVPRALVYAIIAFGFVLMAIRCLARLVSALAKPASRTEET
jgi:TRAP-type C4-dicarboxylate transport system permease small subunit